MVREKTTAVGGPSTLEQGVHVSSKEIDAVTKEELGVSVCVLMDVEHLNIILRHEEAIKELIQLDTLVPKLYNKRLLTKDEREDLLDFHIPRTERKIKLVKTLSNKGKDAPRLLIECLREEKTHFPHAQLAKILEHDKVRYHQCGASRFVPLCASCM